MSLAVGVDFGTATTAVAVATRDDLLRPRLLSLAYDAPLVNSEVWFARNSERAPLIARSGDAQRYARSVFLPALEDFLNYWQLRVLSQSAGTFEQWRLDGNEADMLLRHFKPELSERLAPTYVDEITSVSSSWDPMSQSTNIEIQRSLRKIAAPGPSEDDLVVATAAIFRAIGQRATTTYQLPVSHLAIGIPSLSSVADAEAYRLATERRLRALEDTHFARDYGARDFTVTFHSESLAAATGIDLSAHKDDDVLIIVDAGAGTTDLSMVSLRKLRSGLVELGEERHSDSHRFGGRDLNEAVAHSLLNHNTGLQSAFRLLDERTKQVSLDGIFEEAKRRFASGTPFADISFSGVAGSPRHSTHQERESQLLTERHFCYLVDMGEDFSRETERLALLCGFSGTLDSFLNECATHSEVRNQRVSVVFVGGAFRFSPFCAYIESRLDSAFGFRPKISFDANAAYLQTAVALGLGRIAGQQLIS